MPTGPHTCGMRGPGPEADSRCHTASIEAGDACSWSSCPTGAAAAELTLAKLKSIANMANTEIMRVLFLVNMVEFPTCKWYGLQSFGLQNHCASRYRIVKVSSI